ncbi:diaminopimelate epimerase [Rosettibacter firmus]|uniref:diaminopimelate epimerase n=1 Tax=Rosettibacter firmus TaxID=3111522 RepID=UPI00336BCD61
MNNFLFTKLTAAGNDFILIDRKLNPSIDLNSAFIKKICDRRTGIGADGVLEFSDSSTYPFELKYFNSDGSTGVLCANGARCALRYAFLSGRIGKEHTKFIVNDTEYSGEVLDDKLVKFNLNEPKNIKMNFKIKAANQLINASYINTGAPHVVIKITDILKNPKQPYSFYNELEEIPVFEIGREIRYHRDFQPDGTNVNFIDIQNDYIKIRTYEKGIEDETLACGTGSVASALIGYFNYNIHPPIKLITRSGETFIVDFKIENNSIKDLSLTGPAILVFKGELIN